MDQALHDQITSIIDATDDMTIATMRDDGFPQATTVSYVNDGVTIYFGTLATSQKAKNIARCDKVSVTINRPYENWEEIFGLSIGALAATVTEKEELDKVGRLLLEKFPQIADYATDDTEDVAFFRVEPVVISLLDYRKSFGHTDLVEV